MSLKKINENKIKKHFDHIENTLDGFIKNNKIPNILLHGESGSGKKTILNNFLNKLYDSPEQKRSYIMYINCAYGKGIKFIRDELKFFARTNIVHKNEKEDIEVSEQLDKNVLIKTIILLNADKLTVDAQSALRRCIELFSMNTRFFIIVEDKQKLLKPILSRFCDIYIPRPVIDTKTINLYSLKQNKINASFNTFKIKTLIDIFENIENINLLDTTEELYENGISGIDILQHLENTLEDSKKKYELLIYLQKIKCEYKNEKLYIFHILHIYIMRNEINLENICKM